MRVRSAKSMAASVSNKPKIDKWVKAKRTARNANAVSMHNRVPTPITLPKPPWEKKHE